MEAIVDLSNMDSYRPLKEYLTIKESPIEGLGLFTRDFIPKGTDLGISHVTLNGRYIRTPLGGFINHSDNPNVSKGFGETLRITAIKDIESGSEILLKYTFYKTK